MAKYILRRLALLVPTLIGMSIIIFTMVRLMPGDVVDALVGMDNQVTPEAKSELRHAYGLDDPIAVQYVKWVYQIGQGDLGRSYRTRQSITAQLVRALPVTIELALLALSVSVVVAVPLGVLSATNRNSAIDFVVRFVALIGLAFPNFFLQHCSCLVVRFCFTGYPRCFISRFLTILQKTSCNLLFRRSRWLLR